MSENYEALDASLKKISVKMRDLNPEELKASIA
jgi:hypothetical protein